MKTSTTATSIFHTQEYYHQSNVKHGHSEADTIHCISANQMCAILSCFQCDARLIEQWNLCHSDKQQKTYNCLSLLSAVSIKHFSFNTFHYIFTQLNVAD